MSSSLRELVAQQIDPQAWFDSEKLPFAVRITLRGPLLHKADSILSLIETRSAKPSISTHSDG